jgi:RNA-binding protein PNO1
MVVVHTQPSTSGTTQKKNRRKLHKKTSGNGADVHEDTLQSADGHNDTHVDDDELMIDNEAADMPMDGAAPAFPPLSAAAQRSTLKSESRRIPIPPHRMSPLKKDWVTIFGPLTEMLGLQVRMNVQRRCVEIRVRLHR